MDLARIVLAVAFLAPGTALPGADCNRNGSEDAADIETGTSADCNRNGVPDECDTYPAVLQLAPALALEDDPTALAAADFDGDGAVDVAAIVGGGVITLVGDGRGGFRVSGRQSLVDDPTAVTTLDTNVDGRADLVLADRLQDVRGQGTLSILENDGAGGFRPARIISVPRGPAGIAPADLNGDGVLDLVLACRDAGGIAILRGNGTGTYEAQPLLATPGSPSVLEARDLDGDGTAEIAAGDLAGALFIFKERAGEWEASSIILDSELHAFVLADFDGDGDADLAAAGATAEGNGILTVLDGGKGELMPSPPRAFPGSARALAAADLDRDGRADLVAVDEPTSSVIIRRGPLAKNLAFGHGYATGPGPRQALPADLDGDGDVDLCVAEDARVSILINSGSGRLDAPWSMQVGRGAGSLTAVEELSGGRQVPLDFDRDGRRDIAVAHYSDDGRFSALFGGIGGFPEETFSFGPPSSSVELVAADLDGDGFPDLAIANLNEGLSLHWNDGHRTFRPGAILGAGASSVTAADIDDDGDLDLASVGQKLHVWENRGDGTFPRRRDLEVGRGAAKLISADLDADSDTDLAATAGGDSKISVFENLGGGAYAPARAIETEGASRFVAADLDGDGATDLIAEGRGSLLLFWNNGYAVFEPAAHPIGSYDVQSIEPADLDGDGDLDLAVSGFDDGPIELVVNRGRRRLESMPAVRMEGRRVFAIGSADLDADGRVEILAARPVAGTVVAFRILSPEASTGDRNANAVPDGCEGTLFVRGDPDGDGRVGISDAIFVLLHLFRGGAEPTCEASADTDGDGRILLSDPVGLLGYLFRGGPEPAAPFPDCDAPTPGEVLSCKEHIPCGG